MDATLLTGGGIASLLVAFTYAGKMLLDWRRTPPAALRNEGQAVTDANTVNAMLVASLDGLSKENARLRVRVQHLEDENAVKDAKIEELEGRIQQIAVELAALKSRP